MRALRLSVAFLVLISAGCGLSLYSNPEQKPTNQAASTCNEAVEAKPLRRLNNNELINTLGDLASIRARSVDLVPDSISGDFTTKAALLTMSSNRVRTLLTVFNSLINQSWVENLTSECQTKNTDCVKTVLGVLAAKAYRRSLTSSELDPIWSLVAEVNASGAKPNFSSSFYYSVAIGAQAILMSPHFLYHVERSLKGASESDVRSLTPNEMANRLSYAIWGSMPDPELFQAASRGELSTPEEIRTQISRMMKNAKASALVSNFGSEWFRLPSLDQLDFSHTDGLSPSLVQAMKTETYKTINEIFMSNASLTELFLTRSTYLNAALANHYGLPTPEGGSEDFVKVNLEGTPRIGVLTQGSYLIQTASGNDTSVVRRGKFVLDQILCDPPDPPDPETIAARPTSTDRRTNPNCSGCHYAMDSIGLGLENFSASGVYREQYSDGTEIDGSGALSETGNFKGSLELADAIGSDSRLKKCMAEKYLTYALGRSIAETDECALSKIKSGLDTNTDSIEELVRQVANTSNFTTKKMEKE